MEEKEIIEEESQRIVNKGEISREELIKCTRTSAIRGGLSFSIIGIIIAIIGIALLITTFSNSFDASFLPYILIPCGIIIAALPFVLGLFADKFLDNQNKSISGGFKYKYQFNDDGMDITLDSGVAKLHTKLNYLLIYKVTYFDDVVFIYLNSSVVYMLKLSGFENENDRNTAMKKVDKKYKVKNND